jgi:hypothetical protein
MLSFCGSVACVCGIDVNTVRGRLPLNADQRGTRIGKREMQPLLALAGSAAAEGAAMQYGELRGNLDFFPRTPYAEGPSLSCMVMPCPCCCYKRTVGRIWVFLDRKVRIAPARAAFDRKLSWAAAERQHNYDCPARVARTRPVRRMASSADSARAGRC